LATRAAQGGQGENVTIDAAERDDSVENVTIGAPGAASYKQKPTTTPCDSSAHDHEST